MGDASINPARGRYPAQAREGADYPSLNNNERVRKHGLIDAKAEDKLLHQLPDQSDTLVIPITFGGIRGAITARFIDFRSFHGGSYDR